MEAMLALLAVTLVGIALIAPILAIVALGRASRLEAELRGLRAEIDSLTTRVGALGRRVVAEPAPAPAAEAPPARPPVALPPKPVVPRPPERPLPPPPPASSPAPPPSADFATSLGPRLLVAAGALACVVFLALFVKYAWENDWVGPTGRILIAAALSLAAVAAGLRLLGQDYRPLGQGLAGLGLSGLYVSAFGAHGFYDLIPREAAGALMVVITACSVALAVRLDTRLLAALAWLGGYLTPILLSAGQDRALSLFLYLGVLGAGALVLDRRKPWPETLPLAFLGTMILYAGWYARFFRPERFEVAALGLVLFTALFALGAAPKERGLGMGVVLAVAAGWLSTLAAGADRPEVLVVLCLGLAALALRLIPRIGAGLGVVACLAGGLPFLVWFGGHYHPDRFGVAAAWVLGGMLLFLASGASFFPAAAQVAGGLAAIALAAGTDRPLALLALLVAQAGVAVLLRRRWALAEAVGVGTAFLAVLAWLARFYRPARAADALLLAVVLGSLYLVALVVRGLVLRLPVGLGGVLAHLGNAFFAWTVFFRVLYPSQPTTLAVISLGLAALHLALGLAALRTTEDALQARTLLGLAAAFLTVAIPVQLGLHGITLAWAALGALLLWLGLRSDSLPGRLGSYFVLGLAVLRLGARHLPLHEGPFEPVLNPALGTWLFVIATLGLAARLARRAGPKQALDQVLAFGLSTLAVALLFGVLTAETRASFGQLAAEARREGRAGAAESALRLGGVAVSVLWTVFATSLLGAGLGLRSRALFFSAYALFALTAAKVALVDLSVFPTPYRMLSFLALGLLLLAGAYLNLRFRERLQPEEHRT